MNVMEELADAFEPVLQRYAESPAMQRIVNREVNVDHYAGYLRQVFHHTRENPQLQALATVYFRGTKRQIVKRFFGHASSEVGHDQLALRDLQSLGHDVSRIPFEQPLPATTALLSFPFYQIYNRHPVGYLGYLYFLEFLPTSSGEMYMGLLGELGIPRDAMGFIHDHATIDQAHTQMMHHYAQQLITSEHDLASVIYAMRVTGELYAEMVASAFANVDAPIDYGIAPEELPRFDDRPLEADRRHAKVLKRVTKPQSAVHARVTRKDANASNG